MKFNSGQITAVIAIAAIISPVIVAIINDIFTFKLKKEEFQLNLSKLKTEEKVKYQESITKHENQRRSLVANFVSSANRCYQHIQVGDYGHLVNAKEEFAEAVANLIVVSKPQQQKQLIDWLNLSQSRDKNEWEKLVIEINRESPELLKSIDKQ